MNGLYSIMYTNINHLSLNSIHIIMMNLTYDWLYKAFMSVKVFMNNLTNVAILSCCFTYSPLAEGVPVCMRCTLSYSSYY